MNSITKAMGDRMAENVMCLAYLRGLADGWKEGHEHGVAAAQFSDGWPKDEKKAWESLTTKQLEAAKAAFSRDVPCEPDYVTAGQERDIVLKFMRDYERKTSGLIRISLTSRMAYLAFQEKFTCSGTPNQQATDGK